MVDIHSKEMMTPKFVADKLEEIIEALRSHSDPGPDMAIASYLTVLCFVGEDETVKGGEFEPDTDIDVFVDRMMFYICNDQVDEIMPEVLRTLSLNEKYGHVYELLKRGYANS